MAASGFPRSMMAGKPHIMIIGASGVFGSRLTELLTEEQGISLTLAGRRLAPLERIASGRSTVKARSLDRDIVTARDLDGVDMVIDAAGPFQRSHSQVIEAAIAAKCQYIDLADGRKFVANISRFDQAAKEADIAVVTGASSIPALSHAVIDHLTSGWQQIYNIRVGIFPGNRAPRGRAVVEAILSYTGKPVRVFRGGQWQEQPGWGMTHRTDLPTVGKRWASICDTPDQDLLVERYHPKNSAEFFAGLELSVLHLGLLALSLPVRWGLIPTLQPAAGIMLWLAQRFLPFGSDKGAMDVYVDGLGVKGEAAAARWTLQADANRGPYTPTLAALAMVRRLRDDVYPWRGSMACAGLLNLADFDKDFDALGMQRQISH